MLTNAAVKAARPQARAYKIFDGHGLFLFVAPTGLRSFRMRFRLAGKEQLLTIGTWPELSLVDARARCEVAREQLGRGEDPRTAGAASAAEMTVERAARAWHAHRRGDWTPVHAADVIASLERDIFPAIGAMPLDQVTRPIVLKTLRAIEARGRVETARRIQQRVNAVFAFARSEGWCDHDPAGDVAEALKRARAPRRQPAIVDAGELRQLLAAAELVDAPIAVKLASRFLALTAVRLAAVRGARWSEIEDLDGAAPIWRVPAARMKLAAAKKADASNDHLVPLSPAAVEVLRYVRARVSPDIPVLHIFPGTGDAAPIAEGAIGRLYQRAGYAGRHVPHGWRASFSTILNERLPGERGAIDRALGHVGGGRDDEAEGINRKVEGAYNRAAHLPRRRRLFEEWAAILAADDCAGGDASG
ncbi:integrase [Sphingomonas metalli]|uniref:Integrase n=1 Tax=Sphingomonas metalli TaxID=1779358 RepID=A0A916WQR9_9SPHN|nr:integrase arm-type DNA-binding domain-containing protein [Sphingomonas metalli]GGB21667.1 integrase [Sphingomonas metalli]